MTTIYAVFLCYSTIYADPRQCRYMAGPYSTLIECQARAKELAFKPDLVPMMQCRSRQVATWEPTR